MRFSHSARHRRGSLQFLKKNHVLKLTRPGLEYQFTRERERKRGTYDAVKFFTAKGGSSIVKVTLSRKIFRAVMRVVFCGGERRRRGRQVRVPTHGRVEWKRDDDDDESKKLRVKFQSRFPRLRFFFHSPVARAPLLDKRELFVSVDVRANTA